MNVKFHNFDEYKVDTQEAFVALSSRIKDVLPKAKIEHIGSSAIEGAVSKGDLDIFVGVSTEDFESSLVVLQKIGFVIKEDTYRSAELCMLECFDFDIDVGIQLVDVLSKHTNFLEFRDKLKSDATLLKEYNKLKLDCTGLSQEAYREKKAKFIGKVLGEL